MKVAIGVFAHNEDATIGQMLRAIDGQDLFNGPAEIRVCVLSNGSTDDTVARAQDALDHLSHGACFHVVELQSAGKSRTWNRFVHELAGDADILICADADITLTAPDTLRCLSESLLSDPEREVASSWPVKDIATKDAPTLRERLIRLGAGTLHDNRHAICGQLYAMRATTARHIHMPVGLPVEDGFLRAMILTRLLTEREHLERIVSDAHVSHVYRSETTLRGLIRHQVRVVVGGAVNAWVFAAINAQPDSFVARAAFLNEAARDPEFVSRIVAQATPTFPHGYVPFEFLIKRLRRLPHVAGASRKLVTLLGFGLDLVVYIAASAVMARNKAQGFW